MKTNIKFIAITILLLANMKTFAQREKEIKNSEVDGIYLNVSDFKQGKLVRPTDRKHKGDKIKLKQFFISPEIVCIEQNKKTVYFKDSIFAIRLNNGENYRFIDQNLYLIADTSSLYVYIFKTGKTEYKWFGRHRRAKEIPVTYYYFSTDNHKVAYILSLENLRKYALSNTTIHLAVCNKFITDGMLKDINSKTGRFELNETILSVVKK